MATLEKNDAGHYLNPVFFHVALGNLFGFLRFSPIVLDQELNLDSAEFAAFLIDCQLETVSNVFAKIGCFG